MCLCISQYSHCMKRYAMARIRTGRKTQTGIFNIDWIKANREKIADLRIKLVEEIAAFADSIGENKALVMYVLFSSLAESADTELDRQKENAINKINGTDED